MTIHSAAKRILVLGLGCSPLAFSQTPADWRITHDMSGSCEIAFPPDWKVNQPPDGQATTPEGTEALVVRGSASPLTPLTIDDQKLLRVDRLLENSAQRVFYVAKPVNGSVTYFVDVQGKKTRCTAQIKVKSGHSEEEIKRIAATVGEKK